MFNFERNKCGMLCVLYLADNIVVSHLQLFEVTMISLRFTEIVALIYRFENDPIVILTERSGRNKE